MLKGRKKERWDKADADRQRCRQWLRAYIRSGQPRRVTKAVLRETAMHELKIPGRKIRRRHGNLE